jgi:hypothetical protein
MGIRLVSVVFGLAAVTALSGNPTVTARLAPPLSFTAVDDQCKLNRRILIPFPVTDTSTVEAPTRDIAATEPQLAPDFVDIAQTSQRWFQGTIAAGLAQARACLRVDQQAAPQIQQASQLLNGQFQAPFAAVVGDLSTTATMQPSWRLGIPREHGHH